MVADPKAGAALIEDMLREGDDGIASGMHSYYQRPNSELNQTGVEDPTAHIAAFLLVRCSLPRALASALSPHKPQFPQSTTFSRTQQPTSRPPSSQCDPGAARLLIAPHTLCSHPRTSQCARGCRKAHLPPPLMQPRCGATTGTILDPPDGLTGTLHGRPSTTPPASAEGRWRLLRVRRLKSTPVSTSGATSC